MKEFEGKKLLIIGGVRLACDIVRRAQEMGAYVIVADYDENSPAKIIADKKLKKAPINKTIKRFQGF